MPRASTIPDVKPVWVSVANACKISGFGLAKMYELIGDGRVKSTLVDGKRLVSVESVEDMEAVAATKPAPGSVQMRRAGPGRGHKGKMAAAAPNAA